MSPDEFIEALRSQATVSGRGADSLRTICRSGRLYGGRSDARQAAAGNAPERGCRGQDRPSAGSLNRREENRKAALKAAEEADTIDSCGHHGARGLLQRWLAPDSGPEDEREIILHDGEARAAAVMLAATADPEQAKTRFSGFVTKGVERVVKKDGRTDNMGMPQARVTDMHVCPDGAPGIDTSRWWPNPAALRGHGTGQAAACRASHRHGLCVGPPDVIVLGSFTVLIMNLPAARIGDMTAHGGVIVMGAFTVLVG